MIIALFLTISLILARSITNALLKFRETIQAVAEGRFEGQVPFLSLNNELGEISRSLESLRYAALMQENYSKTKSSVAEIAGALQTRTSFRELGDTVMQRLAPLMGLVYGAFYARDKMYATLQRVGGYACDDTFHADRIAWGQGLVGQAAADKKMIFQTLSAKDGISSPIALGKLNIQTILIVPVILLNDVLGVLELGTMQTFSDEQKQLLDMLLPVIAVDMEILTNTIKTRQLLEQSQAQAGVLEIQTAELEASHASMMQMEERSRLILGSVNEGIWGLDVEGKATFANPAATTMLGYSLEELVGRQMHPLVHYAYQDGSRYPDELCPVLMTLEDGLSRNISDEVFWRKNGTPFSIEYSTTPLYKDGKIFGVVVVFRDITERRLTEKAMLDAKLAAEEATRMKSDFLANMSHEIRTPMNAIIGMTHLALQTELSAKQRNYMGKVDTAAKGLLGIINGILDFSKIEAGKMEFEKIDFDLEEVMEHLADLSIIKAQDKGLELLFDIGLDVPTALVGDPLRLGQVLTNLVNNAIKFTEKGEIIVGIHVVSTETNGARLRFDIIDSGIGLTENQRNRLFNAFSQADSSTTRKHGGTGLGLTISKRLVEMMQGEISVKSEPGIGSTFSFTAVFGVRYDQQNRRDTPSIDNAGMGRGRRVLVVDDNANAREIFMIMLASLKFDASVVSGGIEAIGALEQAQLESRPYDLMLMDWRMPGMDGVETVRRIRSDKRFSKTLTCMMVTAYNRDELLQQVTDVPIDGILLKPVNPSTLFDSIMTAFSKKMLHIPHKQQRLSGYLEAAKSVRGAYLLLVEDNNINQELAVEILNNAGIRVDVANNGAEALEKIGQEDYDGVLMDCQMPVMDGFEATRKIRADRRFDALPVIAMTANVMVGDREKCTESGMNDHIAKPIDVNLLFSTLARWVKPRNPNSETPAEHASPAKTDMPCLAGVDMDAALKRVGDNPALYWKLLTRFGAGQSDAVERILNAWQTGDQETAVRLAHTLKGLAGNIGADALYQAADKLESALKHRESAQIEPLSVAANLLLRVLIAQIDHVMPSDAVETLSSGAAPDKHPDMKILTPMLRELSLLLAGDDSRAAKQIDPIAAQLKGSAVEQDFRRLGKLTAQYDFDAALESLRGIAAGLGIRSL